MEKTWKPLAQFRIAEKVKAREAVLFLHNALVGCLFLSSSCVVDVFTVTTKARVPFSWVRCPCTQKESPCSKAFRVKILKMPEGLLKCGGGEAGGISLIVLTEFTGSSWPAKARGQEPFRLQHSGKGKAAKANSRTRERSQLSTFRLPLPRR